MSSFLYVDGVSAMLRVGRYEFHGDQRLERNVGAERHSMFRKTAAKPEASRASQKKGKKKTHVAASNGCCVHAAARALLLLLLSRCRSRRRRDDGSARAERVCRRGTHCRRVGLEK